MISGTIDVYELADTIQHEVEHIYQSEKNDNYFKYSDILPYATDNLSCENDIVRNVSNIIYYSSQFEEDGFVSGAYAYLQKFGPLPSYKNLEETPAYKGYVTLKNSVEFISDPMNQPAVAKKCKQLKLTYNKLLKMGEAGCDRFVRKIGKMFIKYKKDAQENGIRITGNGYLF